MTRVLHPVCVKCLLHLGQNKTRLISLLCSWLPKYETLSDVTLTIKNGDRDADTLVVKAAIKDCERITQPVRVHGTDTDLLILLLFHGNSYNSLFYGSIKIKELWDEISDNER